jgi:hypothetical protein
LLSHGSVTARYEFVHLLYQRALYESLSPARRLRLSQLAFHGHPKPANRGYMKTGR